MQLLINYSVKELIQNWLIIFIELEPESLTRIAWLQDKVQLCFKKARNEIATDLPTNLELMQKANRIG